MPRAVVGSALARERIGVGSALARERIPCSLLHDSPIPHPRGYAALRRGRSSTPGCRYFLTVCTADRVKALTQKDVGVAVREEILRMASEGVWQTEAFTLMPDHVHILADLGDRCPCRKRLPA